MSSPQAFRWIKTECGRAKYIDLASRKGIAAKLRLGWFVVIAAARDLPVQAPDWTTYLAITTTPNKFEALEEVTESALWTLKKSY